MQQRQLASVQHHLRSCGKIFLTMYKPMYYIGSLAAEAMYCIDRLNL
jgi:hypothetical protein